MKVFMISKCDIVNQISIVRTLLFMPVLAMSLNIIVFWMSEFICLKKFFEYSQNFYFWIENCVQFVELRFKRTKWNIFACFIPSWFSFSFLSLFILTLTIWLNSSCRWSRLFQTNWMYPWLFKEDEEWHSEKSMSLNNMVYHGF